MGVVAMTVALHAVDVPDGIYNVCSGRPITVRQLVEGSIADSGYNVRLNLGKVSIPTYEAFAFWVMALRQKPHPRGIK